MRTHLILLFPLLLALACSDDEEITTSGRLLGIRTVPAEEGYLTVLVRADGEWRVHTDASWLTVQPDSHFGTNTFTLYYADNSSSLAHIRLNRQGRAFITRGGGTDTLLIRQCGLPATLDLPTPRIQIEAQGVPECSAVLSSNLSRSDALCIRLSTTAAWITNLRMADNGGSLLFSVMANSSAEERQAEIRISFTDDWGETVSALLTLTQKGS